MMGENVVFAVSEDDADERLDCYIARSVNEIGGELSFSRSMSQRLIEDGFVSVGGVVRKKNYRIVTGDVIDVKLPPASDLSAAPQDIPLDIVYEDSDIIVVNKPKGMVVHPAAGHGEGTLVNALLYHCSDSLSGINGVRRPGIVHRIDKDTSGLLLVAKNDRSHVSLARQLYNHTVGREYRAVCHGSMASESGIIDRAIARDKKNRKKFTADPGGKNAVTEYSLIENFKDFAYVSLRLRTGRTHQIRVHFSSIGHPLAGDAVYGGRHVIKSLGGQCLHAKSLSFFHPGKREHMRFDSEMPEYFTAFLEKISRKEM